MVTYGLGLASAASPCLLPLYPAFLAYLTGAASAEAGSGGARRVSGFLGLAVLAGLINSMLVIGLIVVAVSAPISALLGFGLPLVLLPVLARTRQDSVVRFLARHHRKIEIVSGVLLIGAGTWDLWLNWESILITFGL